MKTTPFHKLEIGSRFYTHKSYGCGANSGVLMWEVLEKINKRQGRVVEAFGGFFTQGAVRSISSHLPVYEVAANVTA